MMKIKEIWYALLEKQKKTKDEGKWNFNENVCSH